MRWVVLVVLCACRIGFDARRLPADALAVDNSDAPADAPVDAAVMTVTFGERPTSQHTGVTRDTTLMQTTANSNHGNAEDLSSAEFTTSAEHSLLRFDLSSVAPGTPVVAAGLALGRINYGDETAGPVIVRLVTESWVEGTGMVGTGASWNTRDGTTAWTTLGGTTTLTLATIQAPPATFVVTIDPAIVQMWVDDPASNDGVLITVGNVNAHYHYHARDSQLNGRMLRPELAIDIL